ncbi:class I SAM-dependent methyltransferase [Victivallis sp. Marseille-Q1083]|uniref:class I SAM-dependent methyltransferase n=1 Tax=Victivallis sp. Marseille-Q1083 TaxID=2717288 RepID=UPI00158B2F16|nr:methyltransferase domain-containing protein [Victivallis sp. Marseille-Q1083]
MERLLLLKQFLKNPSRIGALCPSSRSLCRQMIREIGMERAGAVVELGPGTGVITREILATLPDGSEFFAVELDPEIYRRFHHAYPQVNVFNCSAEELTTLVATSPMNKVDVIVSGLPWAAFPGDLQDRILDAIVSNLNEGGYFTTFAYLQGLLLPAGIRFRHRLKQHFREVKISPVVWRNLPPAVVYRCRH